MKAAAALLLALLCAAVPQQKPQEEVWEGKPAPELAVSDFLDTPEFTLEGLRGRIVVAAFWTTWCGPCQLAMPDLKELRRYNNESDVVLVGVNILEHEQVPAARAKSVRACAERLGLNFPVVLGGDQTVENHKIADLPLAVVVDADGKIAFRGKPSDPRLGQVLGRLTLRLQDRKYPEIEKAVPKGEFDLTVARGKGHYCALSNPPKEFRVVSVSNGRLTALRDGKKVEVAVNMKDLAERVAAMTAEAESWETDPKREMLHVVIRTKAGDCFIWAAPLDAVTEEVRAVVEWVDGRLKP